MVGGPALAGVVGLGAVGGIIANIALTPLTAGASLLQSYWYGAGLILGERMMYTVHWEKIKVRLDRGESFLGVLDKIMNDDITAIANLSFKAMDETGKLFLEEGTANLGKFIEELLAAALNPFFSGPRDPDPTAPPPEGEPSPEGIVLSITEINNMSFQTLSFETGGAQILKYSPATQQHMLTRLAELKLQNEQSNENQDTIDDFFRDSTKTLLSEERAFLDLLLLSTLATIYSGFIPSLPSDHQTQATTLLLENGLMGITSTRRKSAGTEENIKKYQDDMAFLRQQYYSHKNSIDAINSTVDADWLANENRILKTQLRKVNAQHILIWVHQLVYI